MRQRGLRQQRGFVDGVNAAASTIDRAVPPGTTVQKSDRVLSSRRANGTASPTMDKEIRRYPRRRVGQPRVDLAENPARPAGFLQDTIRELRLILLVERSV